jgi:septal ring factor EnvC (AmiA/AmiB activator)
VNNFKCWLCNKEFTTPDITFAHLDDKHGGVLPAMANRISSLAEAQSTLTSEMGAARERAASLQAVIGSYELASKTAISAGNALLKERDALKAEVAALKKDDFDTLRVVESENESLNTEVARLITDADYLRKERDFARADCRRLRGIETLLREALRKYGKHAADCNTRLDNECSCGLLVALAPQAKEEKS